MGAGTFSKTCESENTERVKPAMILIPVEDVSAGLAWYQRAFPEAHAEYLKDFDFTVLKLGDFQLEIVQADAKVPAAQAGTRSVLASFKFKSGHA